MRRLKPDTIAFNLLIGVLVSLQLFGVSITLPVLPSITTGLDSTPASTQLTISAFLAGVAVSQLVYGSLSDRFGRKPVLLAGLALYTLAGIGCALAPRIEWLIGLRVLQGAGAAASMVVPRAMIRDLFDGRRGVQMMSRLSSAISVIPMVAPLLGGWLLPLTGWRGIYAVLAVSSGMALAASALLLGESIHRRDPTATDPRTLLANCRLFFTTPGCLAFVLMIAFAMGSMSGYSVTSAFVFINVYGVSGVNYGWLLTMTGIAMFIGSVVSEFIARRWSIRRFLSVVTVLNLGLSLAVLAGASIATHLAVRGPAGIALIIVPMLLYGLTLGPVFACASASALQPRPEIAGVAAALIGSVHMLGSAFFVWLGGLLFDGTPSTIGYGIALGSLGTFLSFWLFARRHIAAVR